MSGYGYPAAQAETYTPDRLVLDTRLLVTRQVTIGTAANLARGTLLGRITASGKYIRSLSAASDGSQTPVAILAHQADAAAADVSAGVYVAGEFDAAAVLFGASHTFASTRDALEARGIHLKQAGVAA